MKTVIYQQIQDQAAEMAGRPKEKLPLSESAILLMQFATELKIMWNCQAWYDLLTLVSYTPTVTGANIKVSLNEGTANEIGDVLWAGNVDPRTVNAGYCGLREYKFIRRDNEIDFTGNTCGVPATVWLEWQLPPTDLLAVSAAPGVAQPVLGYGPGGSTLSNLLLPARFYQPLSALGAATLLTIDGMMAQASAFKNMAQANLDWQSQQPGMEMPWWRGIRIKRQ